MTITASAALIAITTSTHKELDLFALAGFLIWVFGFGFEVVADAHKTRFNANPDNKGKFIRTGLWSRSRHPNYFGEILEWFGWALATWSLPALGFAVWTFANLVPRAVKYHKWYHEHFKDYPSQRKALLPGIF